MTTHDDLSMAAYDAMATGTWPEGAPDYGGRAANRTFIVPTFIVVAIGRIREATHILTLPGYRSAEAAREAGDALCSDWTWCSFSIVPGPAACRSHREPPPPRPAAGFAFFLATSKGSPMPSVTATNITTAQVLQFGLAGSTPSGDTFTEPTIAVSPATAGSVALQPSVQGTPDASGAVPFTTAGVFTPAAGFTGAVTLSADVQGVDDQDATFSVVPVPAPETVSFDTTKFLAA